MRNLNMAAVIRLKTPLTHNGGEKNGNINLFRREEKFYKAADDSNTAFDCPIVHGNSIRSVLRKMASGIYLDALAEEGQPHRSTNIDMLYKMFSGGGRVKKVAKKLDGEVKKGVKKMDGNMNFFKELRQHNLPLSLFGCSEGNTMLPGKLDIYEMLPIAKETAWMLPDAFRKQEYGIENSVYEYLSLCFNTTHEIKDNPEIMKYLQQLEEDQQHDSIQMLYYTEQMKAGVHMLWSATLRDIEPHEYTFFLVLLDHFNKTGMLGGNRRIGYGRFEIVDVSWQDVSKAGETLTINDNETAENLYSDFMQQHKEKINKYFDSFE